MIIIKNVTDKEEKTLITLQIMNALPEWFSPPEDIVRKSVIHREYPMIAAYATVNNTSAEAVEQVDTENSIIGFATLKIHNCYTAEIYNLGVLKEYHRQGIGHRLVDACVQYCRENHYRFLTIKTLDESAVYEPYNGTRAFYKMEGFYPLEVFTCIWDEENPCLYMIKVIDN